MLLIIIQIKAGLKSTSIYHKSGNAKVEGNLLRIPYDLSLALLLTTNQLEPTHWLKFNPCQGKIIVLFIINDGGRNEEEMKETYLD